ncbi:hypothetical protein OK016_25150 [Vibrio chagasii]|nr:hypothetical protein [Vibrio chagasii]
MMTLRWKLTPTIQEDTATDLNLELVLGDSVEDGQLITGEGNSATGKGPLTL